MHVYACITNDDADDGSAEVTRAQITIADGGCCLGATDFCFTGDSPETCLPSGRTSCRRQTATRNRATRKQERMFLVVIRQRLIAPARPTLRALAPGGAQDCWSWSLAGRPPSSFTNVLFIPRRRRGVQMFSELVPRTPLSNGGASHRPLLALRHTESS